MYYYKYINPPEVEFIYFSDVELVIGEDATGDNRYYVPCDPPPRPITTQEQKRKIRNMLLQQSDWTQLEDAPLTEEKKQAWKVYRQQLRDVPETFVEGQEVLWPEIPK